MSTELRGERLDGAYWSSPSKRDRSGKERAELQIAMDESTSDEYPTARVRERRSRERYGQLDVIVVGSDDDDEEEGDVRVRKGKVKRRRTSSSISRKEKTMLRDELGGYWKNKPGLADMTKADDGSVVWDNFTRTSKELCKRRMDIYAYFEQRPEPVRNRLSYTMSGETSSTTDDAPSTCDEAQTDSVCTGASSLLKAMGGDVDTVPEDSVVEPVAEVAARVDGSVQESPEQPAVVEAEHVAEKEPEPEKVPEPAAAPQPESTEEPEPQQTETQLVLTQSSGGITKVPAFAEMVAPEPVAQKDGDAMDVDATTQQLADLTLAAVSVSMPLLASDERMCLGHLPIEQCPDPEKVQMKVILGRKLFVREKGKENEQVPLFVHMIRNQFLTPGHLVCISSHEEHRLGEIVYEKVGGEEGWFVRPLVNIRKYPDEERGYHQFVRPYDERKRYRTLSKFLTGDMIKGHHRSSGGGIAMRFWIIKFDHCFKALTKEFLLECFCEERKEHFIKYKKLFRMYPMDMGNKVMRTYDPDSEYVGKYRAKMGNYPEVLLDPETGVGLCQSLPETRITSQMNEHQPTLPTRRRSSSKKKNTQIQDSQPSQLSASSPGGFSLDSESAALALRSFANSPVGPLLSGDNEVVPAVECEMSPPMFKRFMEMETKVKILLEMHQNSTEQCNMLSQKLSFVHSVLAAMMQQQSAMQAMLANAGLPTSPAMALTSPATPASPPSPIIPASLPLLPAPVVPAMDPYAGMHQKHAPLILGLDDGNDVELDDGIEGLDDIQAHYMREQLRLSQPGGGIF